MKSINDIKIGKEKSLKKLYKGRKKGISSLKKQKWLQKKNYFGTFLLPSSQLIH